MGVHVWVVRVTVQLLDAHLGNGTDCRIATMTTSLLLTSGLMRYDLVLHNCGTSLVGGGMGAGTDL